MRGEYDPNFWAKVWAREHNPEPLIARLNELEAEFRDTLRAVLHHFGPDGAHKVTATVIEEKSKRQTI